MLYILQRTPMSVLHPIPSTLPSKYDTRLQSVRINDLFLQNGGRGVQDDNNNQSEKGPQGVPACPVLVSQIPSPRLLVYSHILTMGGIRLGVIKHKILEWEY